MRSDGGRRSRRVCIRSRRATGALARDGESPARRPVSEKCLFNVAALRSARSFADGHHKRNSWPPCHFTKYQGPSESFVSPSCQKRHGPPWLRRKYVSLAEGSCEPSGRRLFRTSLRCPDGRPRRSTPSQLPPINRLIFVPARPQSRPVKESVRTVYHCSPQTPKRSPLTQVLLECAQPAG